MLSLRIPLRLVARVGQAPARVARPSIAPLRSHQLSLASSRTYASAGRPKESDSETPSSDASPKRKRSTAPKKASDKPKKTTTTKPKKTTTKPKKTNAKPRKKAAKRKPTMTPEEKALKAEKAAAAKEKSKARAAKLQIRELKEKALSPPTQHVLSAFVVFNGERTKGVKMDQKGADVSSFSKVNAEEWKKLDSREREHYNHITNEKNREAAEAYQQWLSSVTPDQVRQANSARRRLRRLFAKSKQYPLIKDERQVKHPVAAYFYYSIERRNSGDFRGVNVTQASKDIGLEWNALSASEKKKYLDLAAKDSKRYEEEYTKVYGHPPPYVDAAKTTS